MHNGAAISLPEGLTAHDLEPNRAVLGETKKRLVIATSSYYPSVEGKMNPMDEQRAGLALESFRKARDLNYPVFCCDGSNGPAGGGSDPGWIADAQQLGVHIVTAPRYYTGQHDFGKSLRYAIERAMDARATILVRTEPEKHFMILNDKGESPIALAATRVYDASASMIVPRRQDNLCSYPFLQQMNELTGNLSICTALQSYLEEAGAEDPQARAPYLDFFNGTRVFDREMAGYFLRYPGYLHFQVHHPIRNAPDTHVWSSDRWDAAYIPVEVAILNGKTVKGVAVDYQHPSEQTALEKGILSLGAKRYDQLTCIIEGTRMLLKSHGQGIWPYKP